MNTNWSGVFTNTAQQTQFLRDTGLTQLPADISALTDAQWRVLEGIVGTETAQGLRQPPTPPGGTIAAPSLPPPGDGDFSDIMAKVAEIQAKLGELQAKIASDDIKGTKDDMAAAQKKEAERIQKMLEKLEKAATSGKIGKIFGWIGAAVGLLGAIVATVATGGAAAPALAVAVLGMTMMILQETGTMEKIVEAIAEKPGLLFLVLAPLGPIGLAAAGTLVGLIEGGVLDEDQAKMAVQMAFAVSMLVTSLVAAAFSGGASAAGAMSNIFKIAGLVGQFAGAASQIGAGAAGIAQSAYSYEAAQIQADSKENQAWLAKLQAMLSEEMERLQEIIDKMNSDVSDVSEVLTNIAQSHRAIFSNMGV